VAGEMLRMFERAVVLEVGGYASRVEGVIADPGLDADVGRAALNHAPGAGLGHAVPGGNHSRG